MIPCSGVMPEPVIDLIVQQDCEPLYRRWPDLVGTIVV